MKSFTSLDLQQRTGDIQRAVISEPVVITNHGQPRLVISTVEEFTRLKQGNGEPVPAELRRERRAVVRRGLPEDPLAYDTSDFLSCARAMADAALSGKNKPYVAAEIAALERRFPRTR